MTPNTQGRIVRDPIDCPHCGVTFTPHRYNQRFCSTEHQLIAYRKNHNVNFESTMIPCAYCGKEFLQWRKFHKCCSQYCASIWYRERTKKEPMPNQQKHDIKIELTFKRLPASFITVVDDVIAHKLSLPSDLVTTRRVVALALKRHPLKISAVERSALHTYINNELESMGGELEEDFQNSVDRSLKDTRYPASAIYRMKVRA